MSAGLVKSTETIASFSVPSIHGIRVECVLHYVRSGAVERICSLVMRPFRDEGSPNRRVGHHQQNRFSIWMAKEQSGQDEVKFLLESTGCVAGDSWHCGRHHDDVHLGHRFVLITGDVTQEIPEQDSAILFVGGDAVPFTMAPHDGLLKQYRLPRFRADKRMTPMQFAEQNKGTFFVVTLRWYIADLHVHEN